MMGNLFLRVKRKLLYELFFFPSPRLLSVSVTPIEIANQTNDSGGLSTPIYFVVLCKCVFEKKKKESQKLMAWQTKCWGRLLAKSCHWCRVSGIEYWGIVALWHWLGILAALERDWNIGNVSQLSVGIRKTKRSGQMLRANNVILMLFAVWWGFNYEKLSICLPPGRNGGKCGKMRETARQMSHAGRKKCPVIAALIPMDRKNRRCLQNDRE